MERLINLELYEKIFEEVKAIFVKHKLTDIEAKLILTSYIEEINVLNNLCKSEAYSRLIDKTGVEQSNKTLRGYVG